MNGECSHLAVTHCVVVTSASECRGIIQQLLASNHLACLSSHALTSGLITIFVIQDNVSRHLMKTEMNQTIKVVIKLFAHTTTIMLVIMQNVVLVMYICNDLK